MVTRRSTWVRRALPQLLVAALLLPVAPPVPGAERRIDLDGNPINGDESRVVTRVLQSYPVQVENTIFNNAAGVSFSFDWAGAGPGGFRSYLTSGPEVGTIWLWTSISQVFTIESPAIFTPSRGIPVIGSPSPGVQPIGGGDGVFVVPGKSINPTEVTVNTESLISTLITFFSPEQAVATCGVDCGSGECMLFVENLSGGDIVSTIEQQDCCLEPNQIFCDAECTSYLSDPLNCGGCGVECAADELCSEGACVCPPGLTQCGDGCVDLLADPGHCGDCGTACGGDQFCDVGACACTAPDLTVCDGVCTDLETDDANCGACGNACAFDEFCEAGVCEERCPGQTLCGDVCVDLASDPLHCGACDNACGSNDICTGGSCRTCRPPRGTACDNECVNIHTNAFHCGGCGMVCDFTDCPSTGTGTCSQGRSCVCDPPEGESVPMVFEPQPWTTPPGRERVEPRRGAPAARASSRAAPRATPVRAPSTATQAAPAGVQEAPVCDLQPMQQMIPGGSMFLQAQAGARFGREIRTTVTIRQMDGQLVSQGPCALIVPVLDAVAPGVLLSPVEVVTSDATGDGLCQPGEAWCDYLVTAVNVGDSKCVNPVATLSSPPDGFNPNEITFLSESSPYGSWPEYPGLGQAPEERTNQVPFRIAPGTDQEPDVGRVFRLTVECMNLQDPVEMPLVLGIGSACDPETDLDGETYDHVLGLQGPVHAQLVPAGNPVQFSGGNFNLGSTIPLKLTLSCGSHVLVDDEIEPNPSIVSLVHTELGPLPLTGINGDNNANPDDPAFSCGDTQCDYQFRTAELPVGTLIIGIQMPDSRVFEAGLTLRP